MDAQGAARARARTLIVHNSGHEHFATSLKALRRMGLPILVLHSGHSSQALSRLQRPCH